MFGREAGAARAPAPARPGFWSRPPSLASRVRAPLRARGRSERAEEGVAAPPCAIVPDPQLAPADPRARIDPVARVRGRICSWRRRRGEKLAHVRRVSRFCGGDERDEIRVQKCSTRLHEGSVQGVQQVAFLRELREDVRGVAGVDEPPMQRLEVSKTTRHHPLVGRAGGTRPRHANRVHRVRARTLTRDVYLHHPRAKTTRGAEASAASDAGGAPSPSPVARARRPPRTPSSSSRTRARPRPQAPLRRPRKHASSASDASPGRAPAFPMTLGPPADRPTTRSDDDGTGDARALRSPAASTARSSPGTNLRRRRGRDGTGRDGTGTLPLPVRLFALASAAAMSSSAAKSAASPRWIRSATRTPTAVAARTSPITPASAKPPRRSRSSPSRPVPVPVPANVAVASSASSAAAATRHLRERHAVAGSPAAPRATTSATLTSGPIPIPA